MVEHTMVASLVPEKDDERKEKGDNMIALRPTELITFGCGQIRTKDDIAMGCLVGCMPFTLLGLPLGTTRPKVEDYLPLLNRIDSRMMGFNTMLSYDGRLILVNSVLSSLPTFYLSTFKIPAGVIDQIDCYRKHVLWDSGDINRKGGCLVTWKKACRSKEQGGLGIIDLKNENSSLLLKFLHKLYNHEGLPWVQITWRCFYQSAVMPHVKRPVGSCWWKDVIALAVDFF
jgi:hypothetical protein